MSSYPCYYALGGINLKQKYATSCPQQSDRLQWMSDGYLPSQYFNNKNFINHRLDLLNGNWPKGCDMCQYVEEQDSGVSMRQEVPADTSYTDFTTGITKFDGLKTIEIRFSNSCNMACLHCSQAFSSGWVSKLKRYQPDEIDKEHNLIQLTGQMHRESKEEDLRIDLNTTQAIEIAEDLNKNFPNLERVDFSGGEVLYQKQFFPTLQKLAEHPNAKNIYVMFHTNFNAPFDPVALNECLEKFGSSEVKISIDSSPQIYQYFRGGSWKTLQENIQKFKEVRSKKTKICLVCTTGVYQIMQFKDVLQGLIDLECDYIDYSIIYTPDYLNPALMMLHFGEQTLKELNSAIGLLTTYSSKRSDIFIAYQGVKSIRKYITKHKVYEKEWIAFKEYIKKTDLIWKQDFNHFFTNYYFDKLNNRILSNV